MFYLRYLRSELVGRRTRTILTLVGLAVGVALVITITGLARGLDHAQKTALNPLSTIGTDLTVTLSPQQDTGGFGRAEAAAGEVVQANQSAVTDLSKLGKPGTHFVHDFFLPGTQLTFPQKQTAKIASLPGVAAISNGLVLSAVHQEGVVPKIVAKIKTGGQQLDIRRQIKPPTAAEAAAIQACFQKLGVGGGRAAERQPERAAGFRRRRARRGGGGLQLAGGAGSACRRGCASSARGSPRPSRRCGRSSARRRRTSRAPRTRSAASIRRSSRSGS